MTSSLLWEASCPLAGPPNKQPCVLALFQHTWRPEKVQTILGAFGRGQMAHRRKGDRFTF